MGIRLLGSLRLPGYPINRLTPRGLSGLAWDEDAGLLYAISDDGKLFHMRPILNKDVLTDVQTVAAYSLRDKQGRPLIRPSADSEGLAIQNGSNGIAGDSQLIVSFEGHPRIVRYTPTGKWLKDEPMPLPLSELHYKDLNKTLEAVSLHPHWGILTALEWPVDEAATRYVPIISLTRSWQYPLYQAPNSGLVAMESLPDGSLLTLERAFVSLLQPLVIALRRTEIPEDPNKPLKVENVAVFDTSQGWLLDNFEGLTRYRDRYFFMISDDNHAPLQNTLLVYFELLPPSERSNL